VGQSVKETEPHSGALLARLRLALVLTVGATALEVAGGALSGSLSLLSDAGHMGTDALAFALALWTIGRARAPHTYKYTYGFHRAEVLGAFVNGVALGSISLTIAGEAIRRLLLPSLPNADLALSVALIGLLINSSVLLLLRPFSARSLGARGAFLHALSDSFSSLGAITGNLLVKLTHMAFFDGLLALIIGLSLLRSSAKLILDSSAVLLEGAPERISAKEVAAALQALPGVKSLHDLHIWTIGTDLYALTCHVVVEDQALSRAAELLARINELLRSRFGIAHVTIQLDTGTPEVELRGLEERRRG